VAFVKGLRNLESAARGKTETIVGLALQRREIVKPGRNLARRFFLL
jgi:hypothetical protein